MIFIILVGNWCPIRTPASFLSYHFGSFSLIRTQSKFLSRLLFLWIALYISMSFIASYGRGVSLLISLFFVSLRRIASALFFPRFATASLYLPPTLIVTHHKHVGLVLLHICTTKSIIVYIMLMFAFLFFFGVVRLFVVGQ